MKFSLSIFALSLLCTIAQAQTTRAPFGNHLRRNRSRRSVSD
jgi:hypothetical protein